MAYSLRAECRPPALAQEPVKGRAALEEIPDGFLVPNKLGVWMTISLDGMSPSAVQLSCTDVALQLVCRTAVEGRMAI